MGPLKTNHRFIAGLAALAAAALFASAAPASAALKTPADRFVRTADYYLRAGTDITPDLYPQLAKYDLLILPAEAQVYNAAMFKKLRELNPTILIVAYVPSKSFNYSWSDPLHAQLAAGIDQSWWLLDPSGQRVSVWPGTAVLNGATGWNSYLPNFVKDRIMSTGYWDGVMYDEFSANISWVNGGNIDMHRSGTKTDPALADTAWHRGMINILKNTRDLLGPDAVIITNGDSTDDLQPYVNGRMFESFPTPWEAGGTWSGVMANYLRLQGRVGYPPVFVVNANTNNSGENADFRKVRYSLGSTLLGVGFFSFDFGESDHGQLWRYDEEDARLGRPLAAAVNLLPGARKGDAPGLWRRDFEQGVVLVNATASAKTVKFNGELERLHGSQAPDVNNGSLADSVTLPPSDGLILLKPIDKLVGAPYPNGSYARVFNSAGQNVRNGFFAYTAPFPGSAVIEIKDIDADGAAEKVVADQGQISVYSAAGDRRSQFKPFDDKYGAAVSFALGDVDGDGKDEIIAGTGKGAAPQARVFSQAGAALGPAWYAFDTAFRGGVSVAAGDLNGDGRAEIVAGAGPGGGPQVRVFNRYGRALQPGFFAYDYRFRGGVQVAAGDVNGDGKTEIVTGAGPGGGPHIRIFDRYGKALGKGFFAADPNSRGGVRVAVADVDGDGKAEIASLTTDVFQFSISGVSR